MKLNRACWLVALALGSMVANTAFGQAEEKPAAPAPASPPPSVPTPRVAPRPDRLADLTKRLSLTDEQREKIKPVIEEETKQIKAMREDRTMPVQDRRKKYIEVRKTADQKIRAFLNPEQAEKWEKIRGLTAVPTPPGPVPAAPEKK